LPPESDDPELDGLFGGWGGGITANPLLTYKRGGGGGGTRNVVDRNVLAKCIGDLFGVRLDRFDETRKGKDGLFVGYGPNTLDNGGNNSATYIKNYVGFSSAQITAINNALPNPTDVPRNSQLAGLTIPTNPYTNYTAYDALAPLVQLQVHELGNSLQIITEAAFNPDTVRWNPTSDYDAGQLLEQCVRDKGGFK